MARVVFFTARQAIAITLAALGYFAVRGITEGSTQVARANAARLLELERRLHLDVELAVQQSIEDHDSLLTLANWIYIFGHWPVVIATLVWLAVTRRDQFYDLRNALFISGAIGLVIYATWAVMPPRLVGPQYIDTVTIRSTAYRLLQPPALVNKYAAVPSLHVGWNLLVGIAWFRATTNRAVKVAGVLMPAAMAFAVVATANHWIADVILGGVVACTGLAVQRTMVGVVGSPFRSWADRPHRAGADRATRPTPAPIKVSDHGVATGLAHGGSPCFADRGDSTGRSAVSPALVPRSPPSRRSSRSVGPGSPPSSR